MSGPKRTGSDTLADAARICEREFTNQGLKVIARVWDSERAFDLALCAARGARIVVRFVVLVDPEDYRALKTMLAAGDFDRAVLVYAGEDKANLSREIATYPLCRIEELTAALTRESGS